MRVPLTLVEQQLVNLAIRDADAYVKQQLTVIVQSRGLDVLRGRYQFERDDTGMVLVVPDEAEATNGKLSTPAPCS